LDDHVILVTTNGKFKGVPLSAFRILRPGKECHVMPLMDGDELGWVHRASATDLLALASSAGKVLVFPLTDRRLISASFRNEGKKAMKMRAGERLVSTDIVQHHFRGETAAVTRSDAAQTQLLHPSQQTLQPSSQQMSQPESTLDDVLSGGEEACSQVPNPSACSVHENSPQEESSDDEPSAARSDVSDFSCLPRETDACDSSTASSPAPLAPGDSPFAGVTLLLVSQNGRGKRLRLLDIGIGRHNRSGKKVWKLSDQVAAICVIPAILSLPEKPRDAFTIYLAKHLEAYGTDSKLKPEDAFAELSPEARTQLSAESAQEHENYNLAVGGQKLRAESRKQVFICTVAGNANRVAVESIPEKDIRGRGGPRALIQVPPGDRVCAVCLLSGADDAPDEWSASSSSGSNLDLGTSLPGTHQPDNFLPGTPLPGTPMPGTPDSQSV